MCCGISEPSFWQRSSSSLELPSQTSTAGPNKAIALSCSTANKGRSEPILHEASRPPCSGILVDLPSLRNEKELPEGPVLLQPRKLLQTPNVPEPERVFRRQA